MLAITERKDRPVRPNTWHLEGEFSASRILVGTAIALVLWVIAIYALAVSFPPEAALIATMGAFP